MSRSELAETLRDLADFRRLYWQRRREVILRQPLELSGTQLMSKIRVQQGTIAELSLVMGSGAAELACYGERLPDLLRVVEATDSSMADHAPLSPLDVLDIAQVSSTLELLRANVDDDAVHKIRDLLGRIDSSTYETPRHPFRHGLLGLIYDVPSAWQRAAGLGWSEGMQFAAGRTFGFNLPGLVGYFGLAASHGATLDEVRPAYEQFLAGFTVAREVEFVTPSELLLVGRVFHGVIGGRAVGEILDPLVDELWRGRG